MPGDRFPIDSVVHGEYMKWSIVEAGGEGTSPGRIIQASNIPGYSGTFEEMTGNALEREMSWFN